MSAKVSRPAVVLFVLLAAAALLLPRDPTRRNLQIFPEMVDSPAYRSQSPSPVFPDGRTLRPPVPGTIPRGFRPFRYAPTDADRDRAGRELLNPVARTFADLERGRLVYESFCLHCHGRSGEGDGPVGRRASALSMSIVGKATADLPDGALFHIVTHGRNNMPAHAPLVSQADRWRAIHYVRDLQSAEAERLRRLGIEFTDDPRRLHLVSAGYGRELFEANCATCHGAEGTAPRQGVPTLNSPRVLAVADEDYYLDIITHGRTGSEMPAWGKILTPTQIRSLTAYIRSWAGTDLDRERISAARGDERIGRALYRGNCSACHGLRGEGGIGNSLSSPSFLALASDSFLRDTISMGRGHTAMPSATEIGDRDVSDILAFIRSWGGPKPAFEDVKRSLANPSPRIGKKLYRARCASCHGRKGEGGIGSRLASGSFLSMADDRFLYRAIVEGRPGTAMPAWRFLKAEDVADLISHVRTFGDEPVRPLGHSLRRGRAEFGEILYRQACSSCHGQGGRGGTGNQIANPVFLASANDEFLWRTIAYGKEATAMRGFLKGAPGGALMPMSASEIEHVVAYLRRLQARPGVDRPRRPRLGTALALGRQVYEKTAGCAKCHGTEGEGANGPALGNPDFLRVASDGYLTGTVILGREQSEMLSHYRGGNVKLTPREVEAVVAYVRDFENRPPTRERPVDMSEGAVAEGRGLFAAHCASCHGSEGRGPRGNRMNGYAPSLNNPEFLRAAGNGLLLATIARGRPGTPMRPFARGAGGISDLTATEIRQIVAFIRSLEAATTPEGGPAGEAEE